MLTFEVLGVSSSVGCMYSRYKGRVIVIMERITSLDVSILV